MGQVNRELQYICIHISVCGISYPTIGRQSLCWLNLVSINSVPLPLSRVGKYCLVTKFLHFANECTCTCHVIFNQTQARVEPELAGFPEAIQAGEGCLDQFNKPFTGLESCYKQQKVFWVNFGLLVGTL